MAIPRGGTGRHASKGERKREIDIGGKKEKERERLEGRRGRGREGMTEGGNMEGREKGRGRGKFRETGQLAFDIFVKLNLDFFLCRRH